MTDSIYFISSKQNKVKGKLNVYLVVFQNTVVEVWFCQTVHKWRTEIWKERVTLETMT